MTRTLPHVQAGSLSGTGAGPRDYGPRSAIVNPVCGLIRGGGGTGPKRRYSGAPPGIVVSWVFHFASSSSITVEPTR